MSYPEIMGIVICVTLLFAFGAKVAMIFKNRELNLVRKNYELQIEELKKDQESDRIKLTESSNKVVRMTEDHFKHKLDEKDEQIQGLVNELEAMKTWKEEMKVMMAKFEGASQGSAERMLLKLLDHNQKLSRALNDKWGQVESNLCRELSSSLEKIKNMFADAEKLHQDGIEIISEYESRLPDDFKRKVHAELLQLPNKS